MADLTLDTFVVSSTDAVGARDPIALTQQVKIMRDGFEKAGHGAPGLILIVVKNNEVQAAVDIIRANFTSEENQNG